MNQKSLHCRLLVGTLALGLGSAFMMGCNGGTNSLATNPPVSLTTTINEPTDATATDIAQATVKPADPATATTTMTAPSFSPSEGMTIMPSGTESALQVDCGNTGAVTGSLPLRVEAGQVRGNETAALPVGDSAILFSPNTSFELDDQTQGTLDTTRGRYPRLRIASMKVLFSVRGGRPCTWTIPNHFKLDMERTGNRMYVLKDSYLKLFWSGRRAMPPADGKVTITANLYDGTTKVAGPLVKTAMVEDKTALFTGNTNVPFNRVDITIDLRDNK